MTMSERQKALAGLPYDISDPELAAQRAAVRRALQAHNQSVALEEDGPTQALRDLLGAMGRNVFIETPFHCAYGVNLFLGDNVYINSGCAILDCGKVEIGDGSMFGPAVQIYTAVHPLDPVERAKGTETAEAITIGQNVWVGGAAVLCPGVILGDNAVVGAGSVVVKDVAPNAVVVGNPAKVVRRLTG
ncbi:sugar O-acetyltransferase [Pelagibius litoralis]|uniref:Nodulation protein L n=1 Tax=Pelagibius litoralis TaxID=374515 RepID=A0A967C6W3_9PROT|nr:sugar O-acetyltransferase [Pelagibius litoralis]NIA67677.1 sugar O-acetyltransferase [Pelagibius litoralis]